MNVSKMSEIKEEDKDKDITPEKGQQVPTK